MQLKKLNDQELINLYINGNEHALTEIIERHRSRIFSYIMHIIKDNSLAEDFFQDTFIKVINTLRSGRYNEEGKFVPWVLRIAHNLMIDHFRKTNRQRFVRGRYADGTDFDIFDTIRNEDPTIEEILEKDKVKRDIKEIIERLPEEQREVVKLRYYYSMSFKEIATYTDVSVNTALGRMRYALINLRKVIAEHDVSFT